ncbi:MAG: sodium-dependent bicarbonate transport family permease [Methanosarcinales archaeon]|nr:sodium-dependent bicarbonate transport family permease [Methanosarcinales archaeon]
MPCSHLILLVAITFPFNIIIGIPLYYKVALMLIG